MTQRVVVVAEIVIEFVTADWMKMYFGTAAVVVVVFSQSTISP